MMRAKENMITDSQGAVFFDSIGVSVSELSVFHSGYYL